MKSPYRQNRGKPTDNANPDRWPDAGTATADVKPWANKADGGETGRKAGGEKFGGEKFGGEKKFGGDPRFKDKARFAPKPKKEKPRPPEDCDQLYGIHSVREALLNPNRKHHRLLVTENALVRLSEGLEMPIEPVIVKPDAINVMLEPDAVHQGAYLETRRLPLMRLSEMPQDKVIVALDQVTDPHNVGAILRSAAAFDVGAILTTFRHSPEVTGVLAKAASGALEHVPFAGVTNLSRALTELKDAGYQIVGLDSDAPEPMDDVGFRLPLVLVLGAEGKGLRQSTRALCDHVARLELPGAIHSLNVSNAAAISLYAVQQGLKKKG